MTSTLPVGALELGIPQAGRPFAGEDAVLAYYDGPQLMILASPLHGYLIALAMPAELGPWPFLLAPITPDQALAIRSGLSGTTPRAANARGVREHFLQASAVYLVSDYGAHDLVATPVLTPLPEDWLPKPGF